MAKHKWSVQSILIAIIIFSVLVRFATAFLLGDQAEPISGAYDQVSYDTLAQSILAGKGFSFPTNWYPFTSANEPTSHWSFLYSLYLVAVYAVFGHHPLAARLIQVLLSGLNILLAYRLGRRLFGEWPGLAAAALTACYAYLIFFNAALMTQSFYVLTVLAAIGLSFSLVETPNLKRWVWLGLVLGLGTLLRQTMLFFAPVLFIWIWWSRRRSSVTNRESSSANASLAPVMGILVSLCVVAALILPWTVRNYLTYHDFLLLNSNGGYWLYSSNHPNQGTNFDPNYAAPIPDNLRGLSEPAMDRTLYREALGFISADPTRFLLLSINRTKDYFWLAPSDQSGLINNAARIFSFTLYLPFMLYGLWLSRHRWWDCLPMYLYVAFDTGLSLISWAAPRYRLPSDSVMIIFAGFAVVSLANRMARLRRVEEKSAG